LHWQQGATHIDVYDGITTNLHFVVLIRPDETRQADWQGVRRDWGGALNLCATCPISVPVDQILAGVGLVYEHDPLGAVRLAHEDDLGAALCPVTARISVCVFQQDTAQAVVQVAVSHSCVLKVRCVLSLELAHANTTGATRAACDVATNNKRVVVAFRVRHRCYIAPQGPQVNPAIRARNRHGAAVILLWWLSLQVHRASCCRFPQKLVHAHTSGQKFWCIFRFVTFKSNNG